MSSMTEATGLIRITKIPGGDAPFSIRSAWVGLELPCHPVLGFPDSGMDLQVLSGEPVERNEIGVSVPQGEAIRILKEHDLHVARWWEMKGFPKPGQFFCFPERVIRIISGVKRQKLRPFPEEGVGSADLLPLLS